MQLAEKSHLLMEKLCWACIIGAFAAKSVNPT
jgi:hypothetical protein